MKKLRFGLVASVLMLLFGTVSQAAPGDVLGTVYKGGNIKAYVNGQLVTSYNIGGKTAIILEDLCAIGADTFYNDSLRTLIFISDKMQADENVNIYIEMTQYANIMKRILLPMLTEKLQTAIPLTDVWRS